MEIGYDEEGAKGDMAGIANTDYLIAHDPDGHGHAAASAVRGYTFAHPAGTSEWFLPSAGQWQKMITAAGDYATLRINASLQSNFYWSSTQYSGSARVWAISFNDGSWSNKLKTESNRVRPCLAF